MICDCGAVCLSRKQFHKKLSAFIQFSKKKRKKNACGDYYVLYLCDLRACLWLHVHIHETFFSPTHISNCVNVFLYQSVPALNVLIVPSETLQQRFSDLLFLLTCCGTVTCWQHFISAPWSLRYQMNVSKQHPCSLLCSTVLACI